MKAIRSLAALRMRSLAATSTGMAPEVGARRQAERSAGWHAAVSDALDDELLAEAVERVTAPLQGLDRRCVPLAVAQRLAWAVSVHRQATGAPLVEALPAALAAGCCRLDVRVLDDLPDPPEASGAPGDLTARVAGSLAGLGAGEAGA